MKIIGCFLGDGWVRSRGGCVSFALPKNSKKRKKYLPLLEKEFTNIKQDDTQVHKYSTELAKRFVKLGLDKKALYKRIPSWVWELSLDHKKALIEGYLDTDGHTDKDGIWCFKTPNKGLIEDLWSLSIDVGYHVTKMYKTSHIRGEWYSSGKLYTYDQPTISYNFKISHSRVHNGFMHFTPKPITSGLKNSNFILNRIESIEFKGEEETYDLHIEGTNSYIANGIVVHNSGPNRRPMNMGWVRDLRDYALANNITYHHKQNGGLPCKCGKCGGAKGCRLIDGELHAAFPKPILKHLKRKVAQLKL